MGYREFQLLMLFWNLGLVKTFKVISSVKNLIRKKYTYNLGWGSVLFSRGYGSKNPDSPGIAENDEIAGLFIGIHEEGPFQGEIKKMQPITQLQLDILREQRRID